MRIALLIAGTLLLATAAGAADRDAPITSGTVAVALGTGSENLDAMPTVSISVRRTDTGETVYCADVDAAGETRGDTSALASISTAILLEGFSHSELGCLGVESLPSADRYRVVFAAPNRPVLVAAPQGEP